jgi:hypothetical protein
MKSVKWLMGAVIAIDLLGWLLVAGDTKAYDLCGYVSGQNVCGARWYSHQFAWHDSTGWTGAKQTAVMSSGPKWNSVQDTFTLNYASSPTGPYQANVYLYNLDSIGVFAPGATWDYGSTGDVYNIVGVNSALNSQWTWYTDGTLNQSLKKADVLTVTLHEMGHWMLLGHPCATQPGAVMCPNFVKKWNLTNDDIFGMQSLYY